MSWKLALVPIAVLVAAAVAVGAAAPSQQKTAVVNFRIAEWNIIALTTTKTTATRVTFAVRNTGRLTHEFVVLKTPKPAGSLAAAGAIEAPEAGAVGEISEIKPGAVKRVTLNLSKGHYSLLCNLAGHYNKGQFADFYVR